MERPWYLLISLISSLWLQFSWCCHKPKHETETFDLQCCSAADLHNCPGHGWLSLSLVPNINIHTFPDYSKEQGPCQYWSPPGAGNGIQPCHNYRQCLMSTRHCNILLCDQMWDSNNKIPNYTVDESNLNIFYFSSVFISCQKVFTELLPEPSVLVV